MYKHQVNNHFKFLRNNKLKLLKNQYIDIFFFFLLKFMVNFPQKKLVQSQLWQEHYINGLKYILYIYIHILPKT